MLGSHDTAREPGLRQEFWLLFSLQGAALLKWHSYRLIYNWRMRRARRYLVSGRVQGVGFRYFAADTARREGLIGSVRNLADGRVEAVAAGDAESLERFERALRQGPSRARVEHVIVEETEPLIHGTGFSVD